LKIGGLPGEARKKGDDLISHVAKEIGGWVLFKSDFGDFFR